MAKKPKTPDPVILPDLALTSFSDMMTLMLTFFVLLFSMSEIKKERIVSAVSNFKVARGIMPFESSPVQTFVPTPRVTQRQIMQLRQGPRGKTRERITDPDRQNQPYVLKGTDMFERDTAQLTDRAKNRLREIAPNFQGYNNIIEVRGHTAASSDPSRDPWRVGYERAYNTMRVLVDEAGIRPEQRFRLVSCGDTQPVDPSDPNENRRVEIIMTQQMMRDDLQ